jgi:glycosyltransferase involved in cell wall biosynthesis
MISVVIPLYNKEQYIARAIHSVLQQTFQDFEIVIINDGSTDNSISEINKINDHRIRLIDQENKGVSAARNRGIEEASADYISFLDADDEWEENHLAVIAELINKFPQCGLFGTSYYFCKDGQKPTMPILPNRFSFDGEDGIMDNYYEMASGTDFPIHMSSYAVKKATIQKIGGFPVGIPSGEDIITLARLYTICDFAYSKLPTSYYHLFYEGKNDRPIQMIKPLDKAFTHLLISGSHRKGVRLFVSSWFKRRMVGAIYAHHYKLMFKEFFTAFRIYPFQKKLFTSLLLTFYSVKTGKDLYSINQTLLGRKRK